jgi:hypothetical protein
MTELTELQIAEIKALAFMEGQKAGVVHANPSPTTLVRFSELESKIESGLTGIASSIKEISETQKGIIADEKEFQSWVREEISYIKTKTAVWDLGSKGFIGMVCMVVIAFFGTVINFFIKSN